MAPTTQQKILAAYNGFYGVTLYHNWVKYYGPKGIAPYFLKTEGPVAMMSMRMFACLLCGIAYGLLTAGPKDKTALKITMVGQALMLPLMAIAGFGPDATTYAQPMWKAQTVIHAVLTYVAYAASQGAKTRSSSRRR